MVNGISQPAIAGKNGWHPPAKDQNGLIHGTPRPLITASQGAQHVMPLHQQLIVVDQPGIPPIPHRTKKFNGTHVAESLVTQQLSTRRQGSWAARSANYRGDATHPLNPGTQNSTALTNRTQRRKVGGFVRYRGEPLHPLK